LSLEFDPEQSYSLKEFDEKIKKPKSESELTFTLPEIILLLLYADKETPIFGQTHYMKEIFLAYREIFEKLKVQKIPFFVKHRYGPYSKEVINALDDLMFTNAVTIVGKRNTSSMGIKITDKGSNIISKKFGKLSPILLAELKQKRLKWDTWTTQGIMNYVYTNYENFLERAIQKKRFQPVNWKNVEEVDKKSLSKT